MARSSPLIDTLSGSEWFTVVGLLLCCVLLFIATPRRKR
jgi:hypothetical protein